MTSIDALRRDKKVLKSLTVADVEEAICERESEFFQDHQDWAQQCHSVSVAIVCSDLFEQARVARGSCRGVFGQHSWVVLGTDCYSKTAPILDATLWSYDATRPVLWRGSRKDGLHTPKGAGSIWQYGHPANATEDAVALDTEGLSGAATMFLDMLGPLDRRGWAELFEGPMEGWPAAEIVSRASQTPALAALVPIDILGMLTNKNPEGLYQRVTPVQEVGASG